MDNWQPLPATEYNYSIDLKFMQPLSAVAEIVLCSVAVATINVLTVFDHEKANNSPVTGDCDA